MGVIKLGVAQSSRPAIRVSPVRENSSQQPFDWHGKLLIFAYTCMLLGFLFFLIRGFSYYTTPLELRPHHSDYRLFRPAGIYGLRFGIAGTALMVALLLYSLRKRTGIFEKKGRLKYWLNAHIFCGVAGPLFILLHTSFKLNGLVSISFWSMVAVALSGLFGRYLYQQIPRTIRGKTLSIQEVEAKDQALNKFLDATYGNGEASRLLWFRPKLHKHPTLRTMIIEDIKAPFRWTHYRNFLNNKNRFKPKEAEAIFQNAWQKWILEKHIRRLEIAEKIFHLWHVIHLPFATIMYAIMVIHIIVALLFGISWQGQA